MVRSICAVFGVLVLAVSLSGCAEMAMTGMAGAGARGFGPGAEGARAWGSWEKANAAFDRYIAQGMTPAEAAREATKGPKGSS